MTTKAIKSILSKLAHILRLDSNGSILTTITDIPISISKSLRLAFVERDPETIVHGLRGDPDISGVFTSVSHDPFDGEGTRWGGAFGGVLNTLSQVGLRVHNAGVDVVCTPENDESVIIEGRFEVRAIVPTRQRRWDMTSEASSWRSD